jgi:predicted MFS family arabinose efflux permease
MMLGFFILTFGLGGSAATMAGRALALTWRPRWQIVAFMLLLAMAVRFLHYALLGEELLSGAAFAVDFGMLLCLAWLSFSWTRQRQMKRQYHWLTDLPLEKA